MNVLYISPVNTKLCVHASIFVTLIHYIGDRSSVGAECSNHSLYIFLFEVHRDLLHLLATASVCLFQTHKGTELLDPCDLCDFQLEPDDWQILVSRKPYTHCF